MKADTFTHLVLAVSAYAVSRMFLKSPHPKSKISAFLLWRNILSEANGGSIPNGVVEVR